MRQAFFVVGVGGDEFWRASRANKKGKPAGFPLQNNI